MKKINLSSGFEFTALSVSLSIPLFRDRPQLPSEQYLFCTRISSLPLSHTLSRGRLWVVLISLKVRFFFHSLQRSCFPAQNRVSVVQYPFKMEECLLYTTVSRFKWPLFRFSHCSNIHWGKERGIACSSFSTFQHCHGLSSAFCGKQIPMWWAQKKISAKMRKKW